MPAHSGRQGLHASKARLTGFSPHENLTVGVVLIYTKLIKFCGHVVEVLEWRHYRVPGQRSEGLGSRLHNMCVTEIPKYILS